MKKIIMIVMLGVVTHFGMTKQEFEKANGFPGVCEESTMPFMKVETCTINRYNSSEVYTYLNGHLISWTKPS